MTYEKERKGPDAVGCVQSQLRTRTKNLANATNAESRKVSRPCHSKGIEQRDMSWSELKLLLEFSSQPPSTHSNKKRVLPAKDLQKPISTPFRGCEMVRWWNCTGITEYRAFSSLWVGGWSRIRRI